MSSIVYTVGKGILPSTPHRASPASDCAGCVDRRPILVSNMVVASFQSLQLLSSNCRSNSCSQRLGVVLGVVLVLEVVLELVLVLEVVLEVVLVLKVAAAAVAGIASAWSAYNSACAVRRRCALASAGDSSAVAAPVTVLVVPALPELCCWCWSWSWCWCWRSSRRSTNEAMYPRSTSACVAPSRINRCTAVFASAKPTLPLPPPPPPRGEEDREGEGEEEEEEGASAAVTGAEVVVMVSKNASLANTLMAS
jgi:hypothetical protein